MSPIACARASSTTQVGRFALLKDHPALTKLIDRNWSIIAKLDAIAKAISRSMAEVALNWVANIPGVASVLVGDDLTADE